jgi:chitinase
MSLVMPQGYCVVGLPLVTVSIRSCGRWSADQVAFGAPSSSVSAGNGYVGPTVIQQTVSCVVKGTSCGGYTMRSGTNPSFRGLMTWSINWDRFYSWEFQKATSPSSTATAEPAAPPRTAA